MKTVTEQNDFACMAETIRRRYSRLQREVKTGEAEPEAGAVSGVMGEGGDSPELEAPWVPAVPAGPRLPDLILIDGGRGQLNAACAELGRLGLGSIPVLGLAKEYEEIHLPDRPEPLRLGLDSAAVKLLQRVRDEAHRFANTYNAQLRLKRISESILDEFPGIGDARKQALLKRFGSVQRLRLATVDEIGEVAGFGERLAGELKAFLDARRG
jgi:excinuclease ABC subunit C